jgi:hypothetical protein
MDEPCAGRYYQSQARDSFIWFLGAKFSANGENTQKYYFVLFSDHNLFLTTLNFRLKPLYLPGQDFFSFSLFSSA